MSILFRSWVTFSAVIAVVQGVLAFLSILQHDAILSDLVRQRVSVVAQTTASAFKPIVDLGMPLSMMRNGDAIVARALDTDPEIRAVHVFNPSGIVVYSTAESRPTAVPREVMQAMRLADDAAWSVETERELDSGFSIERRGGELVGGVVVAYPKDRLEALSRATMWRTIGLAVLLWLGFSALSYLALRLLLRGPQRALARLEGLSPDRVDRRQASPAGRGLLGAEIAVLETNLAEADRQYREARAAIAAGRVPADGSPARRDGEMRSSRSLARQLAARMAPLAALFIIVAAVVLGGMTLRSVNRSIEPELATRTNLIGTVVSENVQRALAAGVPLDSLVGAEAYFGDMLQRLPEVAYVAVATGRIVLEAGERIDPYLAPPRERKDVRSHPIMLDGEEIAYVVIDIDPAFIAKRFRDVLLDMIVVVLVTVLVAFEVMVLLTSRSLTAALDRLQRLAAMQAAGDFSRRVAIARRSTVDRMTAVLVERAERLHALFAAALVQIQGGNGRAAALQRTGARFGLGAAGPALLRVRYFTDVRLALFLFAAADELPLSFLPIYTRAADASWLRIDESVLISLPLAGYLLAILLVSPYSRQLYERFGGRRLMVAAAVPTLLAHVGLFIATTAPEIVLWRTVSGFGYAIVTLACQDYALDIAPAGERDRTLGTFSAVMFGGIFCGTALGGILADRLGQASAFLVSAGFIAMATLFILWLVSPVQPGHAASAEKTGARGIALTLRSSRFTMLVLGIAIPANVILQAFISFLVALTLDGLGASTADIGRTLMLYFLAIALIGPLAGRAAEARIPVEMIGLAGQALATGSLLLVALWTSELSMMGAVLLAGIGHGLVRGAQVSMAMEIAENELADLGPTTVLGALRIFERGGSVIGLLIIAGIAGAVGYAAATAAVAIWSLAGVVLFGFAVRTAIRRTIDRLAA